MFVLALRLLLFVPLLVLATTPCEPGDKENGDEKCRRKYNEGSYCLKEEKLCSNPFASGCLHYHDNVKYTKRICNSEDPNGSIDCTLSEFDYQEIRILNQDWESAMFSASIMQIVLSEMLGVPSSLEMSSPDVSFNFYDRVLDNRLPYTSMSYDYDALRTAKKYEDCQKVAQNSYTPCAHVMPEVWNGQFETLRKLAYEEVVTPTPSGGLVKFSWYIPAFTVKEYPFLQSYFELSGKETSVSNIHRRLFSRIFERPRTWKDFCANYTVDNCQYPPYFDEENRTIALRGPNTSEEEASYFIEGLFYGHFSPSTENNCTNNATTCTGHIANVRCDWSTFVWQQAHHLEIPVSGNGQADPHGGYSYSSLVEIWHAANYTKSHVLFYWWQPSLLISQFLGTQSQFVPIYMPPPTKECTQHRVTEEERCATDLVYGSSIGVCDSETHVPQKLIVSNLEDGNNEKNIAMKSPAHQALLNIQISELDIEYIFRQWYKLDSYQSSYGYREAICKWAFDNLDTLQTFIPPTYPRSIHDDGDVDAHLYITIALAATALILVLLTAASVYYYREKENIKHAQPMFLYLVLAGLLLLITGAVLFAIVPQSMGTCISSTWLSYLGFTLAYVPVIVKVGSINKLLKNAKNMKRVTIKRSTMYMIIGVFIFCITIYLIFWSIFGMLPSFENSYKLLNELNDQGGNKVYETTSCGNADYIWHLIGDLYLLFLMVVAIVLAFQTRHIRQEFNESNRLAAMVYSHFIFFALRIAFFYVESEDIINSYTAGFISSYILTADTLTMLLVYFLPLLLDARWPPKKTQKYESPFLRVSMRLLKTGSRSKRMKTRPSDTRRVSFAKHVIKFQEMPKEIINNFETNESHITNLKAGIEKCQEKLAALEKELHVAESSKSNGMDTHQQNGIENDVVLPSGNETHNLAKGVSVRFAESGNSNDLDNTTRDNGVRSPGNQIQNSIEASGIHHSDSEFTQYNGHLSRIELEDNASPVPFDIDDGTIETNQTNTSQDVAASSLVEQISLEILETGTILSSSAPSVYAIKGNDDGVDQQPMKPSRRRSSELLF